LTNIDHSTTSVPFKIHYPDVNIESTTRHFSANPTFYESKEIPRKFTTNLAPVDNLKNQRNIPQNKFNNLVESTTVITSLATYTPTIPYIRDQPKRNNTNDVPRNTFSQKFNFETLKYEKSDQLQNVNHKELNDLLIENKKINSINPNNLPIKVNINTNNLRPSTYNPKSYSQKLISQNYDEPKKVHIQQSKNHFEEKAHLSFLNVSDFNEKTRTNHVSPKRFSTLVPRESYNVTTFKPIIKFKAIDETSPFTSSITLPTTAKPFARSLSFVSSTSPKPNTEEDEDDGQYRPEIYEKDFYRNRKLTKTTKTVTTLLRRNGIENRYSKYDSTTKKNFVNSAEDELLKTENSQNIANSHNEFRLKQERERQKNLKATDTFYRSSPKPFSKQENTSPYQTKPTTSKPIITANSRTTEKINEKDVSYDYAYYDTHDADEQYPDYIGDFRKTSRKI
jgi:hypothetical protein